MCAVGWRPVELAIGRWEVDAFVVDVRSMGRLVADRPPHSPRSSKPDIFGRSIRRSELDPRNRHATSKPGLGQGEPGTRFRRLLQIHRHHGRRATAVHTGQPCAGIGQDPDFTFLRRVDVHADPCPVTDALLALEPVLSVHTAIVADRFLAHLQSAVCRDALVPRCAPGFGLRATQRYLASMRFRGPHYRGIAPLTAAGAKMSRREYEEWRDAHTWPPSRETRLVIETDLAPAAWIEPLLLGHWCAP